MKMKIALTVALAAAYALLHGVAIETNIFYRQRDGELAVFTPETNDKSMFVAVLSSDTMPLVADAAALGHSVFGHPYDDIIQQIAKIKMESMGSPTGTIARMFPNPVHPALTFALSAVALVLAAWMVVGIVRAALGNGAAIRHAARHAAPAYLVALVAVLAACCALGNMPASSRLALTDAAGRHAVAALGGVSAAVALAVLRIAICRADEMHSAYELAKEAARHPPANYT